MKYYTQVNRFLQKYGSDAFKIIAAYEEAADIPPTERYANWYGDYGIFEPSLNEDMTYDKLLSRYKAGLKYLGIINEQAKAPRCCRARLWWRPPRNTSSLICLR